LEYATLSCSKIYRAIFNELSSSEQQKKITQATLRGEVYGSKKFHKRIAKLIDRPTQLVTQGGDRKSETFCNQAG